MVGWLTLLVTCSITLVYSAGRLRAVILTDFVQFISAMVGSVWAVASWTYQRWVDWKG